MTTAFLRLTITLGAALASAPTLACRVGGDTVLFAEKPVPKLVGVVVMKVRLVESGPHFTWWNKQLPYRADGKTLIGVARSERHNWFPVYATVTSCTHQFFGGPGGTFDRAGFIVGRFVRQPKGQSVFLAAGDWNGRWHQ